MADDLRLEIRHLEERYEKAPESRIFAPLADAYRKKGEVDRAIELCEKGLETYPDYASAHVILGKCFYDKGATERSRSEFERVIEIDPENMVALKFMGDIQMMEGHRDESIASYRKIIAIDPTNEEVAVKLKGLEEEFSEKDIDLGEGSTVRKASPRGELATMTLAGIYAAQGYYKKALKIYREILEEQPDNKDASEMVAKIEEMIESSNREAAETFEEDPMTISIDDLSDEMAESTAGPGTGPEEVEGGEEEPEGNKSVTEGSVLGDEDELEKVARELEEADRGNDQGGTEEDEEDGSGRPDDEDGIDNFRRWLQKMRDAPEEGKD